MVRWRFLWGLADVPNRDANDIGEVLDTADAAVEESPVKPCPAKGWSVCYDYTCPCSTKCAERNS